MIKTAIIDDGEYHGELCAAAFREVTGVCHSVNVKLEKDESGFLNVSDLCEALERCAAQGVRLVSLSAGTAYFKGIDVLERAVNKARDCGVFIVSSADNGGKIFYPACMVGVFGVCYDALNLLQAGEYAYAPGAYDGVNWIVSRPKKEGETLNVFDTSNSRAAAVFAGVVYNVISRSREGLTYDELVAELAKDAKTFSAYSGYAFASRKINKDEIGQDTVIVAFTGGMVPRHDEVRGVFTQNDYSAVSIKNVERVDFVNRVFAADALSFGDSVGVKSAAELVIWAAKPDLLFIDVENVSWATGVEYDVIIGGSDCVKDYGEIAHAEDVLFIDGERLSTQGIYGAIVRYFKNGENE